MPSLLCFRLEVSFVSPQKKRSRLKFHDVGKACESNSAARNTRHRYYSSRHPKPERYDSVLLACAAKRKRDKNACRQTKLRNRVVEDVKRHFTHTSMHQLAVERASDQFSALVRPPHLVHILNQSVHTNNSRRNHSPTQQLIKIQTSTETTA